MLLTLATIACSGEPEVVERVVEIEVPVEVVKEVEVESSEVAALRKELEALKKARPTTPSAARPASPQQSSSEGVGDEQSRTSLIATPGPTATPRPTATPVPTLDIRRSKRISAGGKVVFGKYRDFSGAFTCLIRQNGAAECWGLSGWWDNSERTFLTEPDSLLEDITAARALHGHFTEISVGGLHTCALTVQGNAVCWRQYSISDYERDPFDVGQMNAPGNRFVAISAGDDHTCALSEKGEVACWGRGYDRDDVPGGRFTAISAGARHTCGLRASGDALCWGNNHYNQAESVTGRKFVAISAGGKHTCALSADGKGACWGGSRGSDVVPLEGPFVMISAGGSHACALYEDGTATCWGDGGYGQTLPPGGRFLEIASGEFHTCGLRENGAVVCWGDNAYDQSSPPPGLSGKSIETPIQEAPRTEPTDSSSFDAASILARFSTGDAVEGERRADAAGEIIAQYESGNPDTERALGLMHVIAPELSIEERRQAAAELAQLSQDGEWDEHDTYEATQHLAAIIMGEEVNAERRIAAANEMVALYEAGDLDAATALDLMDIIAPHLGINERRQAAATLARLAAEDDWSHENKMLAASETFRLVTGVPLDAERRIGAAVELTGVGVRLLVFDSMGHLDERGIDATTEVVKRAVSGNLTQESLEGILGVGN